jgi:adenylate cyclase
METQLSPEDLQRRSGATADRVRACVDAGLVGTGGEPPGLDVERLRLVGFLMRRGFSFDQIVAAERQEGFLTYWAQELAPLTGWADVPAAEIADRTGLPIAFLQRVRDAGGSADEGGLLTDDDVELLGGLRVVLEAGLSEDEVVEMVMVSADALGRVAEAEVRLFHFYVHERLRASGLSGDKLRAASDEASQRLPPTASSAT